MRQGGWHDKKNEKKDYNMIRFKGARSKLQKLILERRTKR